MSRPKMRKNRSRTKKIGLPPGSIVFTGEPKTDQVATHYMYYNEIELGENVYAEPGEFVLNEPPQDQISWIDMRGIHDTEFIEQVGTRFNMHSLVQEDISDVHQRPKFEDFDDGVFLILRTFHPDDEKGLQSEQVAVFFSSRVLLSFQEREEDLFFVVRERLRRSHGRIRSRGTDYLCYALVDVLVDHYFSVVAKIEEQIEEYEDELYRRPDDWKKEKVHSLSKDILLLRRTMMSMQDAISRFLSSDSPLINRQTRVYLRDLLDHMIQLNEMLEDCRELVMGLRELFLSEMSLKMNQVMKVLTQIATIFIPLTFIAGIYGMNFSNMPELNWKYGYFTILAIMVFIFFGFLFYFRKKKWF